MIINTVKEAEKFASTVEVGASWVFDGWPEPITEETPEEYDKLMEAAFKLESEIADIVNAGLLPKEEEAPVKPEKPKTKRTIRATSRNETK